MQLRCVRPRSVTRPNYSCRARADLSTSSEQAPRRDGLHRGDLYSLRGTGAREAADEESSFLAAKAHALPDLRDFLPHLPDTYDPADARTARWIRARADLVDQYRIGLLGRLGGSRPVAVRVERMQASPFGWSVLAGMGCCPRIAQASSFPQSTTTAPLGDCSPSLSGEWSARFAPTRKRRRFRHEVVNSGRQGSVA